MNNVQAADYAPAEYHAAFTFHGRWKEYLPIAATNFLLTLVTLGFYRFWATTRERKYLWSRTQFIDERLEWAGTGKEMFIGFLVAMLLLLPLLLFFQFGFQALILRGEMWLAGIGFAFSYLALFYLIGVARFRALRYRLSRTYWRGIRGGSDDPGWRFGFSYLWRYVLAFSAMGLMIPWAMVSLWRERWGRMSFGSYPIRVGNGDEFSGLMGRYLLIYAAPFLLVILFVIAGLLAAGSGLEWPSDINSEKGGFIVLAIAATAVLSFYIVIPVVSLGYFAAFYRKVVGEMSLAGIEFDFTARTKDWIKLVLGNVGLVIVTLGFGLMFIGYRNWSFFVRHMTATGEIDLAELGQSTTRLRSDAEGLADAFDIGAI